MADKKHKGNNRNKEKVVKSITLDAQENIDKQEVYNEIKKGVNNVLKEYVGPENTDKALTMAVNDVLKNFDDVLNNIINNETYKRLQKNIRKLIDNNDALKKKYDEWIAVKPFLEEEIKKPKYNGRSLDDLSDEEIEEALSAARAAMLAKELPQITYNDSERIKTSTDKFSNIFFSLNAPARKGIINGQREFTQIRYEKQGAKKEITLQYDYDYNEAVIEKYNLSREFTDKAFFVASVVDNLLDEGNTTVSLTKLWHEMGNSGSPNADNLTELSKILQLGLSTVITADVSEIQSAWGITDKTTSKKLISPVMPVQILEERFNANGKTANAIVNITGHTPFYLIGNPIDHYSTWSKDILRLYTGRRTARYYSVLRFLVSTIGWLRNPKSKRSNKVTYRDLYEKTGAKKPRAQQLTKDMMYRLIDEVFIPTGYVTSRVEDTTNEPGVIIKVSKNPQAKIANKKKKQ